MPVVRPESLLSAHAAGVVHRFLDARGGPDARTRFAAERIEGSRHLHVEHDLAAVPADASVGGRHPLPSPLAFARALSREGVSPEDRLVVLDDVNGANAAARLYVMLRAIGHENVLFLSGGLAAARRAGLPMASGTPMPVEPSAYPERPYAIPLATLEEVDARRERKSTAILDARSAERFRGENEPFDPVPGHVPGARSMPYAELLDAEGHLLEKGTLRARLDAAIGGADEVIVQCGSGVTACMLMVALEAAELLPIGPGGAKLWVGSYSEWSRRGKPIARGA